MKLFCAIITAVLFLAGCSSVEISQPLPHETSPVDRAEFEGVWMIDSDTVTVRFTQDGVLHFAGVEWKDNQFILKQGKAYITKGQPHNYLSLNIKEEEESPASYAFLPYTFTDNGDLIFWPPRYSAFAEAVEAGELKGTVNRGEHTINVKLSNTPEEVLKFLESRDGNELFKYDEPQVLRKVVGSE